MYAAFITIKRLLTEKRYVQKHSKHQRRFDFWFASSGVNRSAFARIPSARDARHVIRDAAWITVVHISTFHGTNVLAPGFSEHFQERAAPP
jgi:hypothetical protein